MQDVPMWWPTNKPNVVFLDTSISTFPDGQVEVEVYRKTTHTDKYLSFNSHHPMQHKRSVVSTLMRRANAVPSNQSLKTQEQKLMHIQESLQTNGYSVTLLYKHHSLPEGQSEGKSSSQTHWSNSDPICMYL